MPVWLRVLVVLAAGAGMVACAQSMVGTYRETVSYQHAADCPAEAATTGGCTVRWEARVVDKDKVRSSSGGVTDHKLRIRWEKGDEWMTMEGPVYSAAYRGSRAVLRTWQGSVVSVTVRGRTATYPPTSQNSFEAWAGGIWLLLGLALWAGLSGLLDVLLRVANLGWLFLGFLPLSFLVGAAVFGAGVWEWLGMVALLLIAGGFTIFAHGQRFRAHLPFG